MKNKASTLVVPLVVCVAALVGCLPSPSSSEAEIATEVASQLTTAAEGTQEEAAPTPEEPQAEAKASDSWPVYVNDAFGFQFNYPESAMVTGVEVGGYPTDELPEGMEPDAYIAELQATYSDQLCVWLEYAAGYMYISAPPNEGFKYTICGRTGVGVGELINKIEEVHVGENTYDASGYEFIGSDDMLMNHNETFVVTLEDGMRIEYGAAPLEDVTYAEYLADTKPVLMEILATFLYTSP